MAQLHARIGQARRNPPLLVMEARVSRQTGQVREARGSEGRGEVPWEEGAGMVANCTCA